MSKLNLNHDAGADLYGCITLASQYYSTDEAAFEAYDSDNHEAGYYNYEMTDNADGTYTSVADFPTLDAETYTVEYYERIESSEENAEDLLVTKVDVVWSGSAITDEDGEPYIDLDSYATIAYASQYLHNRLRVTKWTGASTNDQARALNMATELIDKLNYAGDVTDSGQDHEFPRDDDSDYPDQIRKATCLIAVKLLDGYDVDELREEGRISYQAYGSVKQAFHNDVALPHLSAGIPSAEAWDLLLPFLRQGGRIKLDRIS